MSGSTGPLQIWWRRPCILNGVYHLLTVFSTVLFINITLVLILTTLWAFYFIQKLWKDYRHEKQYSKLRNDYPEYKWLNRMQNFKSNRIKNILLLAISVSEIVMTAIVVYDISLHIFNETYNPEPDAKTVFLVLMSCGNFLSYRVYASLALAEYVITSLIRILTEYMVYQYRYHKLYLNLKLEFYISITCFISLIFLAVVFEFEKLFLICCLFLLFYEFSRLVIAGKELNISLRQRCFDARHENQEESIIYYYENAHKDYRISFSIMLVSFFLQSLAISILHIRFFFFYYEYYYLVLPLLATVLFVIGNSIQMLPYLIVSFRRIRNRRKQKYRFSKIYSMKHLIEENYTAYQKRMRFYT